jgi:protein-S-isoprenylcysteine O-methyltransferase Ste14
MKYIFIGAIGFLFILLFDIYTLRGDGLKRKVLGLLGVVLIAYSAIMATIVSEKIAIPSPLRIAAWIVWAVTAFLLVYSLFLELPFKKTYGGAEYSSVLVDTGTYALCRHPGVVWFGLMFFFFFLATGAVLLIPAGIIWTAIDIVHVYIEDKYFFPRMFSGYKCYVKSTPMLMPNKNSIRRCISTLFQ